MSLLFFFLAFFFFYPLGNILRRTLSAAAVGAFLSRAYFLDIFWFTIWQAAVSTGLTLVVGLPVAYLFARYDFPGRALVKALATVPFVMPTVVVAAAFRAFLGANGVVNEMAAGITGSAAPLVRLDQSLALILLAHVFYNVAVMVRLVGGFWANLNPRLNEAARTLGASPWRAFVTVTLPLLRTPLLSAGLLVYLFTFTSFGVILLLGGPRFSTLETEIYRQYVTFLNPDVAAVLSLLQIAFTFGLMSVYTTWQRRAAVGLELRPQAANARRPATTGQKMFVAAAVLGLGLFLVGPLAALVGRSFFNEEGHFTLAYYRALSEVYRGSITFIPPLAAARNSVAYALLTVVTAGSLGLVGASVLARPSRWRGLVEPLLMLPLGASAVTLGFGYVVTYDRLRTSPLLVLIAHTLVAFPFVVRSVLPVMQAIRPRLREAAAGLGASPYRVWREVDLPVVGRALLVGAVFAFTVSLGEFGATAFMARPDSGYLTLPIAIQRYLSQPGALNFGQAVAMSTILMGVSAGGFVAIERFRYGDVGEF